MDSVASIVACMEATVERLELTPIPRMRIREAVGLGLDATFDSLVPGSSQRQRARILETYRRLWFSTFRHRPRPFPAARSVLQGLTDNGYWLAVATGKGREGLSRDLDSTGFRKFFQATRTADETFPKPHPAMVEELLEEMGVTPREALVIGDTCYDLEMAANAGVSAVAVASGSHPRERLQQAGALTLLEGVEDLSGWLAGQEARTNG